MKRRFLTFALDVKVFFFVSFKVESYLPLKIMCVKKGLFSGDGGLKDFKLKLKEKLNSTNLFVQILAQVPVRERK